MNITNVFFLDGDNIYATEASNIHNIDELTASHPTSDDENLVIDGTQISFSENAETDQMGITQITVDDNDDVEYGDV